MKDYNIYRNAEGKLTIEGSHEDVVFVVTAKTEEGAKEALMQLQRFEFREGERIDKV